MSVTRGIYFLLSRLDNLTRYTANHIINIVFVRHQQTRP